MDVYLLAAIPRLSKAFSLRDINPRAAHNLTSLARGLSRTSVASQPRGSALSLTQTACTGLQPARIDSRRLTYTRRPCQVHFAGPEIPPSCTGHPPGMPQDGPREGRLARASG